MSGPGIPIGPGKPGNGIRPGIGGPKEKKIKSINFNKVENKYMMTNLMVLPKQLVYQNRLRNVSYVLLNVFFVHMMIQVR